MLHFVKEHKEGGGEWILEKRREMLTQALVHAYGNFIQIVNSKCHVEMENGVHVILKHAACLTWSRVVSTCL